MEGFIMSLHHDQFAKQGKFLSEVQQFFLLFLFFFVVFIFFILDKFPFQG